MPAGANFTGLVTLTKQTAAENVHGDQWSLITPACGHSRIKIPEGRIDSTVDGIKGFR